MILSFSYFVALHSSLECRAFTTHKQFFFVVSPNNINEREKKTKYKWNPHQTILQFSRIFIQAFIFCLSWLVQERSHRRREPDFNSPFCYLEQKFKHIRISIFHIHFSFYFFTIANGEFHCGKTTALLEWMRNVFIQLPKWNFVSKTKTWETAIG